MEVECSKNEDTTPFCTRNEVRSYPVLMLFTGQSRDPRWPLACLCLC